jgi:hypothetical protein
MGYLVPNGHRRCHVRMACTKNPGNSSILRHRGLPSAGAEGTGTPGCLAYQPQDAVRGVGLGCVPRSEQGMEGRAQQNQHGAGGLPEDWARPH